MDIVCVEQESVFRGMSDAWNHLARLTAPDCVFLRHEWFDAAWQWLKLDHSMAILKISNGTRLAGIFPLVMHNENYRGLVIRQLEFFNIPDTQYCDLLAAPADREAVMAAVVEYLLSSRLKWDRLDVSKLDAGSILFTKLPEHAKRVSLPLRVCEEGANPGISLEQTWQEFYSGRSRRLKKGNNHAANRLKKSGQQVELVNVMAESGGWDRVSGELATITELSSRSWKRATGLTLDNPGPAAFIQRLTEHAFKCEWLSVWLLRFDNVPVAMEYQLIYDGVISALRADFDPAYEDLSPGTYMNWKMLERLFAGDERYYCMGPGGNAYKLRWAEVTQDQYRLTLYNRTLPGRVQGFVDLRLRPLVAYLRRRLNIS